MALYFFKPVVWNSLNYQRPSGGSFTSGYPAKHGFGAEEWNNSDRLEFLENGRKLHIFHTEGLGNQPLAKHSGRIVVFMIAAHKRRQYVVSIAGQATSLFEDEQRRRDLAKRLHLYRFWSDAWRLPSVRKHHQDESEFRCFWKREYLWFPTWVCPAAAYLPLKKPLLLKPKSLTGKRRLIIEYSSYQEIDRNVASRVLELVPDGENPKTLSKLRLLCGNDSQDVPDDLVRIENEVPSETTKRALIDARLGQGKFRDDLMRLWEHRCAVTGCSVVEALRASHVKPWRHATNRERLDPQNGLLLVAHLDALFDVGLISFDDRGSMLISKQIDKKDREGLQLGGQLGKVPSTELRAYLKYHRLRVWRDAAR